MHGIPISSIAPRGCGEEGRSGFLIVPTVSVEPLRLSVEAEPPLPDLRWASTTFCAGVGLTVMLLDVCPGPAVSLTDFAADLGATEDTSFFSAGFFAAGVEAAPGRRTPEIPDRTELATEAGFLGEGVDFDGSSTGTGGTLGFLAAARGDVVEFMLGRRDRVVAVVAVLVEDATDVRRDRVPAVGAVGAVLYAVSPVVLVLAVDTRERGRLLVDVDARLAVDKREEERAVETGGRKLVAGLRTLRNVDIVFVDFTDTLLGRGRVVRDMVVLTDEAEDTETSFLGRGADGVV